MSRYCGENAAPEPILKAAEHWKTTCLLSDGGIFENKELWTIDYFQDLNQHLIKGLDRNNDVFFEKLETLLDPRPPEIKQLVAEIWWLMLLCQNNYSRPKKREDIKTIWERSGKPFPENSEWLTDEVLAGIANVGAGFFARLPWEWEFFILLIIELKRLPAKQRVDLLSDSSSGWEFAEWIEGIPECATRQSRHMVLFLLFPDNFERVFSANHRRKIVSKFTGKTRKLTAVEIDRDLFEIRSEKEKEYGTHKLDFFDPPLKGEWQNGNSQNNAKVNSKEIDGKTDEELSTESGTATNLILYGPPGTGKTYQLNKLTEGYLTGKQILPRESWLYKELSGATWRDAIIGVLYDLGGEAKINTISEHKYIQILKTYKKSDNINTELSEHTHPDSKTVTQKKIYRNPPYVFDRKPDGTWYLVNDWEEQCGKKWKRHVELAKKWKTGPKRELPDERFEGEPDHKPKKYDQRFEFVTFHQAYSYEDFIEGIRPQQNEETGQIEYKVVPGVFKRICRKAKEDPEHRYAIFIDEINRGNIASIFGELITLLETDKRVVYGNDGTVESGMTLTLPYSGEKFGVPSNLDVYGTMNTADRSIALLDTALRRRFQFEELMPDTNVIDGSLGNGLIEDGEGDTIDLRKLLNAVNRRIRFLLSRDMTIGHSYLINVQNFDGLKNVLYSRIIPLLQEYFYDDWHRIQLVFHDVGANGEELEPQIIRHTEMKEEEIIGFDHDDFEDSVEYSVTPQDKITPAAIRKIYDESA